MDQINKVSEIGVYIDSDNIRAVDIPSILREIKKYGRIRVNRVYGDWTQVNEKDKWINYSRNYGITKIQCDRIRKYKDSTDIKMICDILKSLYNQKNIDTYIIVSSDTDFAHVAIMIREYGKTIYAIGNKNTPDSLRNVCDRFISIEVINQEDTDDSDEDDAELDSDNMNTDNEIDNISDDTDHLDLKKILDIIRSSFKGNKKIPISKLKKNIKSYDNLPLKNKYINNLDKFLKKYYEHEFSCILSHNNLQIIDLSIIKSIDDTFEKFNTNEIDLSILKSNILQSDNTFDERNYGFNKFSDLFENVLNKYYRIEKKTHNYVCIKI
tara:strand:- start:267 stop:1241 length:975 start_codon:yes stop_codon:yes gene_type:complete